MSTLDSLFTEQAAKVKVEKPPPRVRDDAETVTPNGVPERAGVARRSISTPQGRERASGDERVSAAIYQEAVGLARDFVACWTHDGPLPDVEEFARQLHEELGRIVQPVRRNAESDVRTQG
jgi:hypothetical protein